MTYRLKLTRWGNGWGWEWVDENYVCVLAGQCVGTAAQAEQWATRCLSQIEATATGGNDLPEEE